MKFVHKETKNEIEVNDPNLYALMEREGFEPVEEEKKKKHN